MSACTVILTGDDVMMIRAALATDHSDAAASVRLALQAAKPVRARAAAKPSQPPRLAPMPKTPGLPPLRPMKVREQDRAERDWNAECERARAAVAAGEQSQAERVLRELIALHRSPWSRRGNAFRSREHDFTVRREGERNPRWTVFDGDGRQVGEPACTWHDAEGLIEKERAR